MLTSSKKKLNILRKVTVTLGCSSCKKPKLSDDVFIPKPRSKTVSGSSYHTRSNRGQKCYSSSSETESDHVKRLRSVHGFGRVGEESVAVEKDSNDPYLDFRRSILQMILENQIYSKDDLKELLNCFLQLNSPEYHSIIVRAFSEIWNGVF